MRTQLIQGLRWDKKPDYEGRMFLTDFTEEKARTVVASVQGELPKLKLLSGDYADIGAAAVSRLQKIADDNLELFVYGLKAALTMKEYGQLDETARAEIVGIIADAVNGHQEECLPLFKHMLRIWPHTNSWSVVNNMLARAYGEITCGDEECIDIVSRGILRDASSWESAMNAMMHRAQQYPLETLKQFEAVFDFMAVYGESTRGKHGIQIRSTIFSYRNSPMKRAYEAQSDEVRHVLREMREVQLANAKPMLDATRGMEPRLGSETCFPEVEALLRRGEHEEAQKYVNEKFSVWKENGWQELTNPDIVDLIACRMNDEDYPFGDKQQLVYHLSKLLRMNRTQEERREVSQRAYQALINYSAAPDSDAESVLAGCAKLMAQADASVRTLQVTPELSAELLALIQLHAGMEVYTRGLVDGNDKKRAIWGRMLQNYNLHPLLRSVIVKMLEDARLDQPESIRAVYRTIAATFGPAGQEMRVLENAVPNRRIAEQVQAIMAYRDGVCHRDREYMHDVLPSIADALDKLLTQTTYNIYYRDTVTLLNVYCAALSAEEQRREKAVVSMALKWARDFCPGSRFTTN
ncbi:MAG: hypothetical protein ACI4O7_02530 [Aristaeellaceae bacterium]